jgi:transcriptional regulator with XRE-family HTH domain
MSINGSKLRELRKYKGIGQAELAKRVGVTQSMISQLEKSTRNVLPETMASWSFVIEDDGAVALWLEYLKAITKGFGAQWFHDNFERVDAVLTEGAAKNK